MNLEPLPQVSVIVPVHDGERSLPALFDSLRKLDYPSERLEILIVDNKSFDRTAEIIREAGFPYLAEDRIQSSYAARNRAVERARGEVLAFTDADCRVDPGWIREGVKALLEQGADLAGGKVVIQVSDPNNLCQLYTAATDLRQEEFVKQGWAITANLLVKRSLFHKLGGFNPRMFSGGDHLFTRQAVAAGFRLVFAERAVIYHSARSSLGNLARTYYRYGRGDAMFQSSEPYRRQLLRSLYRLRLLLTGLLIPFRVLVLLFRRDLSWPEKCVFPAFEALRQTAHTLGFLRQFPFAFSLKSELGGLLPK